MTESSDYANDESHELAGAVVSRVFYSVRADALSSPVTFGDRAMAVEYARHCSAAGARGVIPAAPGPVQVEIRAEYRVRSGRVTEYTVEVFTVTA
ncbi:hypothetical protein KIH31_15735 [Paenarthrobacter sp. DKR-5]|uniref:hypothetical protein n=1 Tax=Paenarthrobacter sp. DKR-5 TaxID=2835535 RepID=UPI001BDC39FA|nr:hypothetical protein [Paenarthrobacter sp. DKR-5]MBT1004038.1 hypothetical protein [Paenarthrobacter sp. DKR-5]